MNQENRQKVLDWCSEQDTYPLYFHDYETNKEEFDPNKYSVDDMVKRVLALSHDYASYNSNTDDYECSKQRWRSALDIWRHIIYYYPTIEIFDVMHSLYSMYHKVGGVNGQFCNDVERRTFKNQYGTPDTDNYMCARFMLNYAGRSTDEFGLDWEDWKDI